MPVEAHMLRMQRQGASLKGQHSFLMRPFQSTRNSVAYLPEGTKSPSGGVQRMRGCRARRSTSSEPERPSQMKRSTSARRSGTVYSALRRRRVYQSGRIAACQRRCETSLPQCLKPLHSMSFTSTFARQQMKRPGSAA